MQTKTVVVLSALILCALILGTAPVMAGSLTLQQGTLSSGTIATGSSYTATTIPASGYYTSSPMKLNKANGYFSMQIRVQGSGTCKVEWLSSNDTVTYREATGATDIATGLVATGGPSSDGYYFLDISPTYSGFGKLKITETGGASSVAVTGMVQWDEK